MVAIRVNGLTKRFGTAVVLKDIDLQIERGELFFLLGPSGCGKTTLLRHIAGFCRPDRGSIQFGHEDVTALPAHLRGTAMMFQSYALWPHLSVAENVAFGLEERKRPRAELRERVEEALALVQLSGLGARRIQQLSGGQQQRVALARALVVRPKCLLLDEPLSNLDASLRLEMRGEIRRICKEFGLTAIYVTHDQEEALSMADRLAVMDAGRLVQVGRPIDVYRNPLNRMVAAFIGETNLFEGRVRGLAGGERTCTVETAAGPLDARIPAGTALPQIGQNVWISVRPEAVRLGIDGESRSNQFRGHIVEASYLGATVQYLLQLEGDLRLKVCEMNAPLIRQPSALKMAAMASGEDVVLLSD